ncbi:hypothetical protein yc1106_08069 [Curvularia clavata]|uniref:AAA+ ATPase domain-containing protein n=1 Tax=Curvularia clavata TaxID=95742 RepID=A0A9Q8ZFJ9_CURCL|nr:hypothetical protein yc1106_08069 [Curvularia clavata]
MDMQSPPMSITGSNYQGLQVVNNQGLINFYNNTPYSHITSTDARPADVLLPKDGERKSCASTSVQAEINKLSEFYQRRRSYQDIFPKLLSDQDTNSPQVLIIHGGPGTGKTSLSRDVAREYYSGGPDHRCRHAWWIGANTREVFETDLSAAMSQLGAHDENNPFSTQSVRSCLEAQNEPWLLILDDMCQKVLGLLHEIVPCKGQGSIIVNTKLRPEYFVVEALVYKEVECQEMEPNEAVSLLRKTAGAAESDNVIFEEIAKEVDYLPFALDLAGAFLKQRNQGKFPISPEKYLRLLKVERHKILEYARTSEHSVYAVISASVHQIQEGFQDGLSVRDILRLISFFLPENIPLDEMPFDDKDEGRERQSKWVQKQVEALIGHYPCSRWSMSEWSILIQELDIYHILKIHDNESRRAYSIHSLFLSWANDTLRDDPGCYEQWRTTAATIIASARQFHSVRTSSERTVLLSQLYPHWVHCQGSSTNPRTKDSAAFSPFFDEPFLDSLSRTRTRSLQDLLYEQIEILRAQGRWMEVTPYAKNLLQARLESHDPDEPCVQDSRTQLGNCLESLGKHKKALQQRHLVLQYHQRDPSSMDYFFATLSVAASLTKLGKCIKAYTLLENLRERLLRVCKEDEDRVVIVQKRLGIICERLGRLEKAKKKREWVLKTLERKRYRPDHPEILDAKTNLAHSYAGGTEQEQKLALAYQKDVLRIESQHLSDDHPRVLMAKENLAWTLMMECSRDCLQEAHVLTREALEHRSRHLGPQNILAIRARIRVAACQIRMPYKFGIHRLAYNELKGCLRSLEEEANADKDTKLWAMEQLGIACFKAKPQSYSLCVYGLILRVLVYKEHIRKYGRYGPKCRISTRFLAEALENLGCFQTALPLRRNVATILCKSREEFDDDRLRALCRLAENLAESPHRQHQNEARRHFKETLGSARRRQTSGRYNKTDIAFYVLPYVRHLQIQGRFDEAIALLEDIIEESKTNLSIDESDICGARVTLAQCRDKILETLDDSNFKGFISLHIESSFQVDSEEECPGISITEGIRYINEIIQWEKDARVHWRNAKSIPWIGQSQGSGTKKAVAGRGRNPALFTSNPTWIVPNNWLIMDTALLLAGIGMTSYNMGKAICRSVLVLGLHHYESRVRYRKHNDRPIKVTARRMRSGRIKVYTDQRF